MQKSKVFVTLKTEMEFIYQKISSELGIIKKETLEGFQRIIIRMREECGIEANL